jgi:hypothetical protein
MSVEKDKKSSSNVESKPKLSLRRETVRYLSVHSGVRTGHCGGEDSLICLSSPISDLVDPTKSKNQQ